MKWLPDSHTTAMWNSPRSGSVAAVWLVVLAIALSPAGAAAGGAGQSGQTVGALDPSGSAVGIAGPILAASDASVDVGASGGIDLSISAAPDGLSGFEVEVSLEDPSVATITGASYPSTFALTETQIDADNATATLRAVDLENETRPGDADVPLASVEVTGEAAGTTRLSIRVVQIDDDAGGAIDPATEPGTITVGGGTPSNAGSEAGAAGGTETASGSGTGGPAPASTTTGPARPVGSGTTTAGSGSPTARPTDPGTSPTPSPDGTGTGTGAGSPVDTSTGTGDRSSPLRVGSPTAGPSPATAGTTGTPGQAGFGAPLAALAVLVVALAIRRRA